MLNIHVEDPVNKSKHYVWQNSWVHGDNQGLVLPPGAASVQVEANIIIACEKLAQTLRKASVRAKAELRDGSTPGYKFNDWEEKGALLGLENRPGDLAKNQTLTMRRDTCAKNPIPLSNIGSSISSILHTIQVCMFATVKTTYWEHNDVVPALDVKNIIVIPWCESEACEDDIRNCSGRS
ncbi:hypothetical protein BKA70DRAFT_1376260 [Coprinopsis sp. MPI-PUGE-AT-0042]|nr:hypothetical protein BKA70DRAFT_1376260 [Coprinopsis sp. MPI-PUGE-AT-0042]